MEWQDGDDGLDLQDKLVGDDDIRLDAVTDWRALVKDGNCDLPREGNARVSQFAARATGVLESHTPRAAATLSVTVREEPRDRPSRVAASSARRLLMVPVFPKM